MSRRMFFIAAVLVTLFLAGVASYYASGSPDGLARVANDAGFADSAKDPATDGSPLAGYETRGVDDERLSGALAGLGGVGLVALLGGVLFWTLGGRRVRGPLDHDQPSTESTRDEV